MKFTCLKGPSGAAAEDQRGQEWKQMGPYLSLPVFRWSPVLPCFLESSLRPESVSPLKVTWPRLESSLRPGSVSALKVTEPRLKVPGLAGGGALWPVLRPWGQSRTHAALGSLGLSGPGSGGVFDRGVHMFSKQTLIHVSRRNLQTDSCWLHPSGERWAL